MPNVIGPGSFPRGEPMNYVPFNYDQINIAAGQYNPSPVKAFNNQYYHYWCRALFQRLQSSIILDVPWSGTERDFLYYCLFRFGYVAVLEHPDFGFIFQPCALGGMDLYYQPLYAIITNPRFKNRQTKYNIHSECEILKATPDFMGCWDIVSHYAEKLAGMDSAVNMSIINNKFAYIIWAKTKAAAESLKKMMDKINKGEPFVVPDKAILGQTKDDIPYNILERPNLRNSYITPEQLNDIRKLIAMFDNEIGIPSIDNEKKERLITTEAEMSANDALSRVTVWNTCLNESFDIINAKYGTTMKSTIRHSNAQTGGDIYG